MSAFYRERFLPQAGTTSPTVFQLPDATPARETLQGVLLIASSCVADTFRQLSCCAAFSGVPARPSGR